MQVETTNLRLIAMPHMLSAERGRIDVTRPVGGNVHDLLRSIGWTPDSLHARVFIDGVYVKDAEWETTIPGPGQSVHVRAIPMGGEGGQGKDMGRMIAMISIMVVAIAAQQYWAAGLVGAAAFAASAAIVVASIGASLAVSALIPPAKPKMNDLSGLNSGASNTLSLNGTSNQLIPYGVMPRVYGRHRIFPPLAARHYSESVGDDQYLRALFCFGPGPLSLSDFKIGTNSIDIFQDVQIEVRQGHASDPPHTLYPAIVTEEPLSIPLKYNVTSIRTSKDSATEISIDLTFPGLFSEHRDGPQPRGVQHRVEYRLQGTSPWTVANGRLSWPASYTTVLAGSNNDLTYWASSNGPYGNNLSIAYVDTGDRAVETLQVTQVGSNAWAFVVGLRKTSGLYSTAAQVMAFLNAASFTYRNFRFQQTTRSVASILRIELAAGNDGSGRVTPMAPAHFVGGLDEVAGLTTTEARTTQFVKSLTFSVPTPGTYEIQLTRLTLVVNETDPRVHDLSFWTALRTVRAGVRLLPAGMASVAVRIRATDQLHGTLDSFNAIAHSILPDWDGATWVERETNNPASVFRNVHQGTANARPKEDSRIDLAALQGLHARCAAHGFEFNAIIDFRSTVAELGRDVLAAGRATPAYRDGKVSCTEDVPQTIPAQVFTPRNSWGFKGTKLFVDLPHALKVRFANADTLEQDERLVIADGYGVTGADGIRRDTWGDQTDLPEATRFESVEAGLGVNDPEQIFKLQRYHLGVLKLRSELFRLSCDFEHLAVLPGDLVHVQHDVPLFGLSSGRAKSFTLDGIGRVATVTLDEPCVMTAGVRYGVRLRLNDGTQLQREVVTVAGAQSTLTFVEPV